MISVHNEPSSYHEPLRSVPLSHILEAIWLLLPDYQSDDEQWDSEVSFGNARIVHKTKEVIEWRS